MARSFYEVIDGREDTLILYIYNFGLIYTPVNTYSALYIDIICKLMQCTLGAVHVFCGTFQWAIQLKLKCHHRMTRIRSNYNKVSD